MELQLQDVLEIFFISSSSGVEEAQTVPLTSLNFQSCFLRRASSCSTLLWKMDSARLGLNKER